MSYKQCWWCDGTGAVNWRRISDGECTADVCAQCGGAGKKANDLETGCCPGEKESAE